MCYIQVWTVGDRELGLGYWNAVSGHQVMVHLLQM